MMNFTKDEYEIIESLLKDLSKGKTPEITLGGLLKNWQNFINEVEKGYCNSIYDYINDLYIRNMICYIIENTPLDTQNKLISMIDPLDERFFQSTKEINEPLHSGYTLEKASWWFRIPKKTFGELNEDLRSDEYIK